MSSFDLGETKHDWALAYRLDIVLRGRNATPMGRIFDDAGHLMKRFTRSDVVVDIDTTSLPH